MTDHFCHVSIHGTRYRITIISDTIKCGGSETFEEADGFSVALYDWEGGGVETMGNSPACVCSQGSASFVALNAASDKRGEGNVWKSIYPSIRY